MTELWLGIYISFLAACMTVALAISVIATWDYSWCGLFLLVLGMAPVLTSWWLAIAAFEGWLL